MMNVLAPQGLAFMEIGVSAPSQLCETTARVPSSVFGTIVVCFFEAASDIHPAMPSSEVSSS